MKPSFNLVPLVFCLCAPVYADEQPIPSVQEVLKIQEQKQAQEKAQRLKDEKQYYEDARWRVIDGLLTQTEFPVYVSIGEPLTKPQVLQLIKELNDAGYEAETTSNIFYNVVLVVKIKTGDNIILEEKQ